ncbi:MBL fold metallo-hydrolase [Pseudomonas aeruginosa]|uniref:MBL fold metallo-hydrolase n=1 Tax=Pseudomonas aeruginosa TaxID=287 RepID=UPI0019131078|nr:MBL fold metallo-hydrolase [Pseudomonas aeruginosa]MDP5851823.1 MBL fold metallo-hydrolase [Pseudomonas aeruginosa]HCA5812751.1 MBL fold metallo-hydrolase [Pseudomonas aeruginosa]HEH8510729.1 MBL fold metallo-hydrolase [Pseudomonas aeruginosa]
MPDRNNDALKLPSIRRAAIGGHHDSPQLRQGRFHNLSPRPADMPAPGARVLWNALFNKPRSTVPRQPLPVLSPSRAELDATVDGSLFRLGHSTLLLKLAGSWWLTDPVFSERASPLPFAGPKRFHAPPVALADLPPIRGVILSHDHYDHLDRAAIKALVPLVELFLAPLGVGDRLLAWGVPPGKVRQLDWWQGIEAGGLRLTATPAQHFSGRGLHDGNRTLWCSWVIESAELKLFFSGDSGYFDGFAEIGRRYGPFDLTMLETGAYNEHWPYVHMHPQQTLQAHRDLGGRWLLPIHNGTFDLAMHAWYEPFERILELATEHGVRVSTPMMGERVDLQAPHAGRRWWREVVDSETQVQGYGCCRS